MKVFIRTLSIRLLASAFFLCSTGKMAAAWTLSLILDPFKDDRRNVLECCRSQGAYMVIINTERHPGPMAIFHIGASGTGVRKVRRTLSLAGEDEEELMITWPEGESPYLHYDEACPKPDRKIEYNIKVI